MIKVAILGTNGLPARYGGFETLAENLTKNLSKEVDFTVYCSKIYKKNERLKEYNNSKLIYVPLHANGFQSFFYDIFTMFHAWFTVDVIIILGPAAGIIFPFNIFFRKKLIVNHGGLNEWEREKLNFFQKRIVYINHYISAKFSSYTIADNNILAQNIRKLFKVNVVKIAYGGDHINVKKKSPNIISRFSFLKLESYDLSISRAQKDNKLHILLKSYKSLKTRNLVLISNWEISNYGKNLKSEYKGKFENIFIIDAIYDKDVMDVIRSNCSLYIHSHSMCGTAPSLVEAMNYNIPIICFDNLTNRETTKSSTKYFYDSISLIKILLNLDKVSIQKISKDLYEIGKKYYNWNIICQGYLNLIKSK